jgi:hypothetical protein
MIKFLQLFYKSRIKITYNMLYTRPKITYDYKNYNYTP